jgi:hypothetical protein
MRSIALAAIAAARDVERLVPELSDWLADVRGIHEAGVDARRAREQDLRDRPGAAGIVQPGLFDRRAVREAETLSDVERALRSEHQRRIEAFDRSRPLTLVCTPAAVLVVWR